MPSGDSRSTTRAADGAGDADCDRAARGGATPIATRTAHDIASARLWPDMEPSTEAVAARLFVMASLGL